VDGGDAGCRVTQDARMHAPDLWVEHGFCGPDCPLNGPLNGSGAGRWPLSMAHRAAQTLNCSDSFRSYDMVKSLSVVEVLDRQSKLYSVAANLARAVPDSETPARLIGGSGEHMVTAALGGIIQPMDSNVRGLTINPAYDVYVQVSKRSLAQPTEPPRSTDKNAPLRPLAWIGPSRTAEAAARGRDHALRAVDVDHRLAG
jgi:hypothetical protein